MKLGSIRINNILYDISVSYKDSSGAELPFSSAIDSATLTKLQGLIRDSVLETSKHKSLSSYDVIHLSDSGTKYGNEAIIAHDTNPLGTSAKSVASLWEEKKELLLGIYYDSHTEALVPTEDPSEPPTLELSLTRVDSLTDPLSTTPARSVSSSSAAILSLHSGPLSHQVSRTSSVVSDDSEVFKTPTDSTPPPAPLSRQASRESSVVSDGAQELSSDEEPAEALLHAAGELDQEAWAQTYRLPVAVFKKMQEQNPTDCEGFAEFCFQEAKNWEDVVKWLKQIADVRQLDRQELQKALLKVIKDKGTSVRKSGWLSEKPCPAIGDWFKLWNKHFNNADQTQYRANLTAFQGVWDSLS